MFIVQYLQIFSNLKAKVKEEREAEIHLNSGFNMVATSQKMLNKEILYGRRCYIYRGTWGSSLGMKKGDQLYTIQTSTPTWQGSGKAILSFTWRHNNQIEQEVTHQLITTSSKKY